MLLLKCFLNKILKDLLIFCRKHLAQRIQDEFPGVTEEKVKELVPGKSSTSCMKLVLHSGDTVGVYVVDGVPMVIETEEGLVPTVCALWKVPELVPTLIIHSPVLPKVKLYIITLYPIKWTTEMLNHNLAVSVCFSSNFDVNSHKKPLFLKFCSIFSLNIKI